MENETAGGTQQRSLMDTNVSNGVAGERKGANERTGSPTRRYLSTQPARLQEAPNGVNAKPVTQLQYAVLRTSSTRYTVLLLP